MTIVVILLLLAMTSPRSAFAVGRDDVIESEWEEASAKARRSHELSMSDVVYQQEDIRALYYQNQQIIVLLKDIRDTQKQTLATLRDQVSTEETR